MAAVREMVRAHRERLIRNKLVETARSTSGPALALAVLFEGQDPDVLIVEAVRRFRYIPWNVLSEMPELIRGGGPINVVCAGDDDLHERSSSCHFGECDAFFSHSWHDDGGLKLDALRWPHGGTKKQ